MTYSVETSTTLDIQKILSEYGDVFKGIGVIPGESKLHIRPDAIPIINPPRRVPEALRDRLKTELQRMEKEGIITKVTEPNSLVIVEKKTG